MERAWTAIAACGLGAAVSIGAATAALAGSAAAMSPDQSLQTHLFGHAIGDAGKAHACFRRAYDAGHLAGHPRQNVRTMTLLVTGTAEDAVGSYSLSLNVTFRKSGAHFETYGECGRIADQGPGKQAEAVSCGIDCDGGQIGVKLKDAKSVLVSIPYGARISRVGADDDSDQRERFRADDKLFRLDRTALTDCLPLADDDDEKAALRSGS